MKHKKLSRKIVAISLICGIIWTMPLSLASAETDAKGFEQMAVSSSIEPQTFTKDYSIYLTSSYQLVMSDSNWWGDRTVKVKFTASEGPTSALVYVADKDGNMVGGHGRIMSIGSTATFTLPSGGGAFAVYVALGQGSPGRVTFNIALTA